MMSCFRASAYSICIPSLFLVIMFQALASDPKPSSLSVRFLPEVALTSQGSSFVSLKIRLSDGAFAQLWIADTCSSGSPSAYLVRVSGEYQIPVSSLGTEGATICLSSTDGLRAEARLSAPAKEPIRCDGGSNCSSL